MSGNHVILVVEDDPGIRETLKMAIEYEGYSVATAVNGKEALSLLNQAERPCVIFLDLMMPEMDGFTFVKELERLNPGVKYPIVLLTAVSEKALEISEKYELLKKPVSIDQILRMVQKYCGLPSS